MNTRQTKIQSKPVKKLSGREAQECTALTFGPNGAMGSQLQYSRTLKNKARAIMLRNKKGDLVSWSLLFWEYGRPRAYFYTKRDQRRKGYARQVYKHLFRFVDRVEVYPNTGNNSFFKKVGADDGVGKKPEN